MKSIKIQDRIIGRGHKPLVIAEIGINHEGDYKKAEKMVYDAHAAGCECVKFQCHVVEDEMIPNTVVPGNTTETIWDIMNRCSLTEAEERNLKRLTESLGMIYLSTPFSRAAANRLENMGVVAYKIGSGECNNYPLLQHIAGFGKPIILSTGMNDMQSIKMAVDIFEKAGVQYGILHCTSLYPTPYEKVRLGAIAELLENFPNAVVGLSDHSVGNWTCFGAVALGASILEKHFTSDKSWPGPDIPISINPTELKDLIKGSNSIFLASGGNKTILDDEQVTIDFAYACVVSIKEIKKGEAFTEENIWVKRPGTGEIKAIDYESLLGKIAQRDIEKDTQISISDIKE